ncbi:SRPBCC domain-containing protein [Pasteurellaceae bacterium LIM206]|nr:SRPBCC domain-containing protein [Pasteurellaceae bacterium LIM206]
MKNLQPAIVWPTEYTPGETDNYCSNEVIVKGLNVADIWNLLIDTATWESYYDNASNIKVADGSTSLLSAGVPFTFDTFGFVVHSQVLEFEPEKDGVARLAWKGVCGEGDELLDIYHAWLIENLDGNRVRILTEESQKGKPAVQLANTVPNPMINGHQAWLTGLVRTAQARKGR